MKWGFGAGLLVCARCKRTVAKSYTECPFCGAPTGEAPAPGGSEASGSSTASAPRAEPPAPPAPHEPEPVPLPVQEPAGVDFELDFGNVPAPVSHAPPENALDFDDAPPEAQAAESGSAWGAIDLADAPTGDPLLGPSAGLSLAEETPAPAPNAPRQPTPVSSPLQADPIAPPPAPLPADLVPEAPSAAPSLGPESAWKAPAPPRNLGEPVGISIPASPAGPRSGLLEKIRDARGKRHPLVWSGLVLVLVALLPLGCGLLVSGTNAEVEAGALAGLPKTTKVRVIDGFASRDDRLDLDPSEPVPLKNPYELVSRPELKGRTVEVVAEPLSLAILKRYRVGSGGQRDEGDARTNVYAPITLDQRVWVVSEPVQARTPSDPPVAAFGSQRTYRGVVEPLSNTVNLDELRHAREEGPELRAMASKHEIPSEALAIVAYSAKSGPRVVAAPVTGTERRVWAMTTADNIPEIELFGDYLPCPNERCQLVESAAPSPPAGVLMVHENVTGALASTIRKAGALLLILGIALFGAGLVIDRRGG